MKKNKYWKSINIILCLLGVIILIGAAGAIDDDSLELFKIKPAYIVGFTMIIISIISNAKRKYWANKMKKRKDQQCSNKYIA